MSHKHEDELSEWFCDQCKRDQERLDNELAEFHAMFERPPAKHCRHRETTDRSRASRRETR